MMSQRGSWNSSPPLISPPLLIILLPILALTLLFLTVPPLLSAATNVLRPASVKTSWDSLNILIVVFAILFGVFARRNDDEQSPQQNTNDVVQHRNDAYIRLSSEGSGTSGYASQQWYGFPEERKVYDESPVIGVSQLRRRSSSYPDLRQLATDDDSYKFRFYDDFEIDKQFRSPAREHFAAVEHRKRWSEDRKLDEEVSVKEIPVDTYEPRPSSPVKSPAPVPPPPPPPPPLPPRDLARRHSRQMHRNVESVREITEIDDREFIEVHFPPLGPPTPPPPRPSAKTRSEQRSGKSSERKKSNVKREIAMVWASVLSNQRKRKKKQRTKNDHDHDHNHHYDNVEVNELTNNTLAPPTPPPPPPPPPPPSVFHSIFRKGLSKNKKIHSVSTPTPPVPVPPPPPSLTSSRRWSKRKNQIPPPPPAPPRQGNTGKPPLPNKASNTIGNQSPLIPPPPPPPPFKISAMKFSVRGDYVKIGSNQSSECSSPEREHIDVEVSGTTTTPTVTVTTVNNAVTDSNCHVNGSVFCPSPDVNVKAASFIARLRGEWRLEKLNSIKDKGSLPLTRGYTL